MRTRTICGLTRVPRHAFLGLLLLFLSFSASHAEESGFELSLQSTILFALHNNPEINIALEQEKQAGFSTQEAEAILYPQIDATLKAGEEYNAPANFVDPDAIIGKSNTNPSAEFILSANQLLYDGSSSREEVKRRETLQESSKLQSDLIQERILQTTIEAYMEVYKMQKTLHEYDDFIGKLTKIGNKISLMVEAGAESKTKLKYAESRLAFAQSDYQNAQAALHDTLTDLEFLTGKLPDFRAKLPEVGDLVQIELDQYKKLAEENNTNFLMNASDKKALEHQLNSVNGRFLPTVNMIVEMSQSHDTGGDVGRDRSAIALLQVSYKIFDGYARDASKGKIESQLNEVDYRRERVQRDVMQKLKVAYNQILALENEHRTLQQEIEANTDLQALNTEQFELGEGDIVSLIEGEERLFTSRTRQYEIDLKLIKNSYALLRQIGFLDKHGFCESC